jgi:hypothetical protein
MGDPSLWLSAAQVAARVGLSESQVRAWFKTGTCPLHPQPFGRNLRVWHVDLTNYLIAGTPPEAAIPEWVRIAAREALIHVIEPAFIRRELRPVRVVELPDTRVQATARRD